MDSSVIERGYARNLHYLDVWTLRGNPFRDAHFVIPTSWKGHFVMDTSCDPFHVTHFVERTLRGWTIRGTDTSWNYDKEKKNKSLHPPRRFSKFIYHSFPHHSLII